VSNEKPTNPKDAIGATKVPWSTLPIQVLGEVGLAMLEGSCKYGRSNYRVAGVRASVYYDAVVARHLAAWWEGQDIDPASGIHHISKAIAGLMVLRDAMLQDKCYDDRPPPAANQKWVDDLNTKTVELLAKYPGPKSPFTKADVCASSSVSVPSAKLACSDGPEATVTSQEVTGTGQKFTVVSRGVEPRSCWTCRSQRQTADCIGCYKGENWTPICR
jgi:hypothetical protein